MQTQKCTIKLELICVIQYNDIFHPCINRGSYCCPKVSWVCEYATLKTMKRFHWTTCREWPLWHSHRTFCWLQFITRGFLASLNQVCDSRDHHHDRLLTRKEWALWQKYHTSCWLHSLTGARQDFPGRVALKLTASMWCKRPPLWQAANNQGMSIIS